MSALRGVIAGGVGLAFLQAVVSSQQAANNVGGTFTALTGAFNHLVDINVPLIPDRRPVKGVEPVPSWIDNALPQTPAPSTPGGSTPGAVPTEPVRPA